MGKASRRRQETTREERVSGREPKKPRTFRQFVADVQEAEERDYASRRGAENDPRPKLLLERQGELSIIIFDHASFATEAGKDAVADAIRKAVIAQKPLKAAFTQPGWGLYGEASLAAGRGTGPTPKNHPDRREIHVLIALDAERVETYVADVERVGKKKQGHLRPWNEHFGGGPLVDDLSMDTYVDSRFINGIKDLLR